MGAALRINMFPMFEKYHTFEGVVLSLFFKYWKFSDIFPKV